MRDIYNVLESVVEELKAQNDNIGIILYGSLAKGAPHPSSDVDLLIINDTIKRTVHNYMVDGIKVQLDYMRMALFTKLYGNEKNRSDDIAAFQVLFDRDGRVTETVRQIQHDLPTKSEQLSDVMRKRALILVSMESDIPFGLIENGNPAGAILLIHKELLFLTNILCSYYGWWIVDEKHIVKKMKANDTQLAMTIEDIILESNIMQKAMKYQQFCKDVEVLLGGSTDDVKVEFDF